MVKIRELREQLGISQKELAERCGITQSFMCDIEQGRTKPSIDVAAKIADALMLNKEAKALKAGNDMRNKLFDKGGCV